MNKFDTINGQFDISMAYLKSVKALEGSDDWATLKDREEFMKLNDAILDLLGYLEIRNGNEVTSVELFKKGVGYKEVQKMNNVDTINGQFDLSMAYLKGVKALEGSDDWVTLKDREEFMKLNDAIMDLLGYLEIRNGKEVN